MASSINSGNIYYDKFISSNYDSSIEDTNNFVYTIQGNTFDKDVWNYNTKQVSLYIENLKKVINFNDKESDKEGYITPSIVAGATITDATITGATITGAGIKISKDKILSLGTKDTDDDICTKLNPHDVGPAFNTKLIGSNNFMDASNWSINAQVGTAIYHNGQVYCVAEHLQEVHFRYNWTNGAGYYLVSAGYGPDAPGYNWSGAITVMNYGGTTGRFRAGDILADNTITTTTLYQTSDRKLKSNITDLSITKSLKLITSLQPKSYTFKADKNKKNRYGFIAQEVEEILRDNELKNTGIVETSMNENGKERLSLSYIDFIAPTVQVIQYQQKEIESLKKEIDELKQIISNK